MGKHANHDVSQWLMGVFFLVALGMSAFGEAELDRRPGADAAGTPESVLTQPAAFAARTVATAP